MTTICSAIATQTISKSYIQPSIKLLDFITYHTFEFQPTSQHKPLGVSIIAHQIILKNIQFYTIPADNYRFLTNVTAVRANQLIFFNTYCKLFYFKNYDNYFSPRQTLEDFGYVGLQEILYLMVPNLSWYHFLWVLYPLLLLSTTLLVIITMLHFQLYYTNLYVMIMSLQIR